MCAFVAGGGLAALGREGLWGCGCGGRRVWWSSGGRWALWGAGRCGVCGGVRMEGVGSTCDPRGLEV